MAGGREILIDLLQGISLYDHGASEPEIHRTNHQKARLATLFPFFFLREVSVLLLRPFNRLDIANPDIEDNLFCS